MVNYKIAKLDADGKLAVSAIPEEAFGQDGMTVEQDPDNDDLLVVYEGVAAPVEQAMEARDEAVTARNEAASFGGTNNEQVAAIVSVDGPAKTALKTVLKPVFAPKLIVDLKTDFGAVGDGVADDTAALQAMATYVTTNGARGVVPPGRFLITSPINFSRRPGWEIVGSGRRSSFIQQATNNTPIFVLGHDAASYMHTFAIRGLSFTYSSVQPSANTEANCISFASECNQGIFDDLTFSRGYYGFKVQTGIGCPWGARFDNLWFDRDMTGGAFDWWTGINGVPNNHFGRILVSAPNMVGPIFRLRGYNFTIDTIEIIQADQGPILFQLVSGGAVTIGAFKLENGTYTTTKSLMDLQGSATMTLGQFSLSGDSMAITGSSTKITAIATGAGGVPGGYVNVDVLRLDPDLADGGSLYAFGHGSGVVAEAGRVTLLAGAKLVDQASSPAGETLTIRSEVRGSLSADLPDADYAVVQGGPNKLRFGTAFTASRNIDLPTDNSRLFNGLYYDFIFNGSINGSNTAAIKCNGTTLRTVSTDKVIVGYTYRRNPANAQGGWVMTKYETLP